MNHLHATRDESMSCQGYFTGAHGANHFQESGLSSKALPVAQCETGADVGFHPQPESRGNTPGIISAHQERGIGTLAPDYQWNVLSHPSIIRSSEERQTRYAAALTCEGGGVDRFIERVSYIVDREMAEPDDFDHDSFAASEFAAGLGGGR